MLTRKAAVVVFLAGERPTGGELHNAAAPAANKGTGDTFMVLLTYTHEAQQFFFQRFRT
jgi:hypothetical protein